MKMKDRTRAEIASKRMAMPEPGAPGFMMGKEGGDAGGHHFQSRSPCLTFWCPCIPTEPPKPQKPWRRIRGLDTGD